MRVLRFLSSISAGIFHGIIVRTAIGLFMLHGPSRLLTTAKPAGHVENFPKGVVVLSQLSDQPRLRFFSRANIDRMPHLDRFSKEQIQVLKAVSAVLPFRVNNYVLDHLIDWDNIPGDPIFQLTFPQVGMLEIGDFMRIQELVASKAPETEIAVCARKIQNRMNPHPAGQMCLNMAYHPDREDEPLQGFQHKYRETVLFFPQQGQSCHSYCTYCFRWPQFVGIEKLKFANTSTSILAQYIGDHPEVTDLLLTGGDPMIMSSTVLRRYIEPLLNPRLESLDAIRIGTKAPAFWPYRFTTDRDADDMLRLFEEVVATGRQLALMVHFSHPREVESEACQKALARIRNTGAVIRTQAPLVRHVNDDAGTWLRMWNAQVRSGAVPYYFFVERNTGPSHYFEVPLSRALRIFSEAYSKVSGLCRTVRGPSMSATPGKVLVDGVATIKGEKVFVLKIIQGRDPSWVNRVFFAKFDSQAVWLDDLKPAFGESEFFFDKKIQAMSEGRWLPSWQANGKCENIRKEGA